MTLEQVKQRTSKHIADGAMRERESLLQAKLCEPLRLIRQGIVAARDRGDVATEAILLAQGATWVHRAHP